MDTTVLLQVKDLSKHFPLYRGVVFKKEDRRSQGR